MIYIIIIPLKDNDTNNSKTITYLSQNQISYEKMSEKEDESNLY